MPLIAFFVLLGLKLAHVIDWSWWWVFAPLWAAVALFLGLLVLGVGGIASFVGIAALLDKKK